MEENIFWDKKITKKDIRKILKNDSNPRFIEFASLVLSRKGEPKEVFKNYLDKITFCKNWRKIKIKMRKDNWNDARINFWDEVYRVVSQGIDKNKLKISKEKYAAVTPQTKYIGETIKEARKTKGWSQKELAEKSGLSQQMISFTERGYLNISLITLTKIIDTLALKLFIESKSEKPSDIIKTSTNTYTYPSP